MSGNKPYSQLRLQRMTMLPSRCHTIVSRPSCAERATARAHGARSGETMEMDQEWSYYNPIVRMPVSTLLIIVAVSPVEPTLGTRAQTRPFHSTSDHMLGSIPSHISVTVDDASHPPLSIKFINDVARHRHHSTRHSSAYTTIAVAVHL